MKHRKSYLMIVVLAGLSPAVVPWVVADRAPQQQISVKAAEQKMADGNFDDAYRDFRAHALAPDSPPRLASRSLSNGVQCLQRLGRVDEIDEFLESVIAVHKDQWRVLQMAAQTYLQIPHQGYRIAGQFHRGPHRGGGRMMPEFWVVAPPLTRAALLDSHDKDDGHGDHASYDAETLRRAISRGIEPSGASLDPIMPRWSMSEPDWRDLLAYLRG